MAVNREEVKIVLGVDITAIVAGLNSVKRQLSNFARSAAGFFSGAAIVEGIKSAADYAEQLSNSAQSLSVSTEFLQDLNNVAVASGSSEKAVSSMLGKFSKTLAPGSDVEKSLREIADKLAGITDPGERARIALEKFGRSGMDLLPVLMQGSKGLDEMAAGFSKLDKAEIDSLLRADAQIDSFTNKVKIAIGQTVSFIETSVGFASRVFGEMSTKPIFQTGSIRRAVAAVSEADAKQAAAKEKAIAQAKILQEEGAKTIQREALHAKIVKENEVINRGMVERSLKELKARKAITDELVKNQQAASSLRQKYIDLFNSQSDVSLAEAFAATDSVRGTFDAGNLQFSSQQMDAIDKYRQLEHDAKQARIDGNTGLAARLTSERIGLSKQFGFLSEMEKNPMSGMEAQMTENATATKELLSIAKANGLNVVIRDVTA